MDNVVKEKDSGKEMLKPRLGVGESLRGCATQQVSGQGGKGLSYSEAVNGARKWVRMKMGGGGGCTHRASAFVGRGWGFIWVPGSTPLPHSPAASGEKELNHLEGRSGDPSFKPLY